MAGTGAALTGLVFVAMSLNVGAVKGDTAYRYRASGSLTGQVCLYLESDFPEPPAASSGSRHARVICVSSFAQSRNDIHYDDPCYDRRPYDPAEAYGQPKAASVLFAVGFSARLA